MDARIREHHPGPDQLHARPDRDDGRDPLEDDDDGDARWPLHGGNATPAVPPLGD